MTTGLLAYVAVAVTALAVARGIELRRHHRLSKPAVYVHGYDVPTYETLLTEPADTGVRLTAVVVASATPLTFRSARYTVQFDGDAHPLVEGVTHAEAKAALVDAGFDDARFGLTFFSPGGMFAPGRDHVAFAVALPYVRRLARLDADMVFADALGRSIAKTVPALPKQTLGRPVTAEERRKAG